MNPIIWSIIQIPEMGGIHQIHDGTRGVEWLFLHNPIYITCRTEHICEKQILPVDTFSLVSHSPADGQACVLLVVSAASSLDNIVLLIVCPSIRLFIWNAIWHGLYSKNYWTNLL